MPATTHQNRLTVLLANEQEGWHQTIRHLLGAQGVETVSARSGREALNLIENRPIHVAVLDAQMPQLGGLQVIKLLRELQAREAQARQQGYKVKVGRFPFAGDSRATILGHHEGFIKVVADEKYGEILGVHIIGPEAFELLGEAVAAMEAEATVDVMMQTIHAHPTLYEAMGEAFNAVYGLSINA